MKIWGGIIGLALLAVIVIGPRLVAQYQVEGMAKSMEKSIKTVSERANAAAAEAQKNAIQAENARRAAAYAAEKVKVFVRARDTRTCMKVLKTEVIDNSVIACNKDHYVEMRRDEVEQFMKEQQL